MVDVATPVNLDFGSIQPTHARLDTDTFSDSLPVKQEHHTQFAESHLYHPDSRSYANRNLTFSKVLSGV